MNAVVGLAVLLVPSLLAVLLVVLVVGFSRSQDRQRGLVARADGSRGWLRPLGAVAGTLAGLVVATADPLGRGVLLAPAVAALGLVVGVLVAELVVRPPTTERRSASLQVRRVRDYLPRGLTVAVLAAGLVLLSLGTLTTLTGSPDDLGREGRWLSLSCSPTTASASGPWPGSYYTVPLAALVLVGLVVAVVGVRLAVSRPPLAAIAPAAADGTSVGRVTTADPTPWVDDELRARSVRAVVAGAGVMLGLPLVGLCLTAGTALLGHGCGIAWFALAALGTLVTGLAAAVLVVVCVAVVLAGRHLPTGRVPSDVR